MHVLSTPPAFILSQDQTLCKSLFPLKTTVWLSLVFTVFRTSFLNDCKEFSRIVCVSLFSYQGHLSCDSLFTLSHLCTVCQVLFSTFFELFEVLRKCLRSDFVGSVQATCLLYHVVSHLSTVIFIFLKNF